MERPPCCCSKSPTAPPSASSSSPMPPPPAAHSLAPGSGSAAPNGRVKASFHRRVLPQECVAFSSAEGRALFAEALAASAGANFMQIYFPLAEQFTTQAEPSFCGLGTLAMCLNALQIDPGRLWKGPWRWFSEELFDCCTPLAVAKERGVTLDEFMCLARCNGAQADDTRATAEFSLEQFRDVVKRSCASSDEIVVLNYSRKGLGQTGDGHFSPIGGYHAERDMVLLMDVARFKYPPHWVRLSLVHEAMQRLDPTTSTPRGLVVLRESEHISQASPADPSEVCNQIITTTTTVTTTSAQCCTSAAAINAVRQASTAISHPTTDPRTAAS